MYPTNTRQPHTSGVLRHSQRAQPTVLYRADSPGAKPDLSVELYLESSIWLVVANFLKAGTCERSVSKWSLSYPQPLE